MNGWLFAVIAIFCVHCRTSDSASSVQDDISAGPASISEVRFAEVARSLYDDNLFATDKGEANNILFVQRTLTRWRDPAAGAGSRERASYRPRAPSDVRFADLSVHIAGEQRWLRLYYGASRERVYSFARDTFGDSLRQIRYGSFVYQVRFGDMKFRLSPDQRGELSRPLASYLHRLRFRHSVYPPGYVSRTPSGPLDANHYRQILSELASSEMLFAEGDSRAEKCVEALITKGHRRQGVTYGAWFLDLDVMVDGTSRIVRFCDNGHEAIGLLGPTLKEHFGEQNAETFAMGVVAYRVISTQSFRYTEDIIGTPNQSTLEAYIDQSRYRTEVYTRRLPARD